MTHFRYYVHLKGVHGIFWFRPTKIINQHVWCEHLYWFRPTGAPRLFSCKNESNVVWFRPKSRSTCEQFSELLYFCKISRSHLQGKLRPFRPNLISLLNVFEYMMMNLIHHLGHRYQFMGVIESHKGFSKAFRPYESR